jgi:tRNA threonylcarbamoyladenosine biosynthesis protein TsaB
MLLLAADTSGKQGSIALARGKVEGGCDIIEVVPLAGGTFSAQLIPQLAELLSKHEFRKQDIEGLAVASGPGSFTGLRIGLAAIKALGEVTGKPIAAVSLLEAVAVSAGLNGIILAALDAGRGEVYLGRYEVAPNQARMVSERLVTRAEFKELAMGGTVVTPDLSLIDFAKTSGATTILAEVTSSDAIGRLGWKKILSGDVVSPEVLEANYIRRTDAEILAKSNL